MRISDWSSDVCSSDLVAAIAFDEGAVVLAIDILGDELRFLDDAVKLAMLADEGDERGKADALRRDPVRRILDRLGDMGASGAAHVPYPGAKHLLLAFDIGVEGAEGDAGPGRDA